MAEVLPSHVPFDQRFEASFTCLQVRIEGSCLAAPSWPKRVIAAIGAAFSFVAEDPASAADLLLDPVDHGAEGQARHDRLVAYLAAFFVPGRTERVANAELSDLTEVALVGGILMIIARHLEKDQAANLYEAIPEAVEFVLAPYLGAREAARIAAYSSR